eukprot:1146070-Pelagomonas_calceolata.AAC.10
MDIVEEQQVFSCASSLTSLAKENLFSPSELLDAGISCIMTQPHLQFHNRQAFLKCKESTPHGQVAGAGADEAGRT